MFVSAREMWWEAPDFDYQSERRARFATVAPPTVYAPLARLEWSGPVNVLVRWGTIFWEGNYQMYVHREPVRMNDPQELRYRYSDQAGNSLSLAGYDMVYVIVKREDGSYDTAVGEILDDGTVDNMGRVRYAGYVFPHEGTWNVQFMCTNGATKRHGHPAQLKVVKNVEDLATSENMTY